MVVVSFADLNEDVLGIVLQFFLESFEELCVTRRICRALFGVSIKPLAQRFLAAGVPLQTYEDLAQLSRISPGVSRFTLGSDNQLLSLSSSKLSDSDVRGASRFRNLRELRLNCKVPGRLLAAFGSLPSLQGLTIGRRFRVRGGVSRLSGEEQGQEEEEEARKGIFAGELFERLERLTLRKNPCSLPILETCPHLDRLTHLTVEQPIWSEKTCFVLWTKMASLRFLDLKLALNVGSREVENVCERAADLPNLVTLRLSAAYVKPKILQSSRSLQLLLDPRRKEGAELQSLQLHGIPFELPNVDDAASIISEKADEGSGGVTSRRLLSEVSFVDCYNVDARCIANLARLAGSLTSLELSRVRPLSGELCARVVSKLPKLRVLRLNFLPGLKDELAPELGGLTDLTELDLGWSGITPETVHSLATLTNLEKLALTGCRRAFVVRKRKLNENAQDWSRLAEVFAKFGKLRVLQIGHTGCSERTLAFIGSKLPKKTLRRLDVGRATCCGRVEWVARLKRLESLVLEDSAALVTDFRFFADVAASKSITSVNLSVHSRQPREHALDMGRILGSMGALKHVCLHLRPYDRDLNDGILNDLLHSAALEFLSVHCEHGSIQGTFACRDRCRSQRGAGNGRCSAVLGSRLKQIHFSSASPAFNTDVLRFIVTDNEAPWPKLAGVTVCSERNRSYGPRHENFRAFRESRPKCRVQLNFC